MSIYIGNHNNNMDLVDYTAYQGGVANEFSDTGWLDQTAKSGVFPGSGSLFLQGLTWTGSFGDSGYYAPYGLVFNPISYDEFDNEIDNTNTLANKNVTFNFDIFKSQSGEPVLIDTYGFSGMEFVQSLNNVQNLLSKQFSSDKDYIGYQYDPINSRLLSGSTNNTPLVGMYTPSGSQQLQYVNFFPQQPPFAQFYNSAFNPLINNVTESVDNTYLQVVEYDNGPIPSNIEPIISSSAVKAKIPDSFYTQKSSIIPRYLGSKVQSADYNNYTRSGSKVEYLGGGITGSAISASDQSVTLSTCFTAGTKISMANNSVKNIEDIIAGESVLTYNETININEEGIVGNISSHEVESILTLTFNNGVVINTTEEHPFFVKEKGWTIASNLETSDICQDINGNDVILLSITTQNETHTVYNLLSVSNNHNFYANEILVHNKSNYDVTSSIYGGDSNPGSMPSINSSVTTVSKHPIYFAHFKTSKENYELWDTYTFRIDQLIECPLDDISGNKAPQSPKVIKLDGSNQNLGDVSSTFEVDRKLQVAYNQGKVAKSGSSTPVNYTSLKTRSNLIYQGGLEYNFVIGTQNNTEGTEYLSYIEFDKPRWSAGFFSEEGGYTTQSYVSLAEGEKPGTTIEYGSDMWAQTGSDGDGGFIRLMGGGYMVTASATVNGSLSNVNEDGKQWLIGPGLGVLHSFNKRVQHSLECVPFTANNAQKGRIGIPIGLEMDTGSVQNYYVMSLSGSQQKASASANSFSNFKDGINRYEDFELPFLINKGDEIRVTWNSVVSGPPTFQTQDFTVTSTPSASANNSDYQALYIYDGPLDPPVFVTVNSGSIYDKIYVSPNPANFDIANGEIYQFTVRRRVNADDRVIVYQTPPTGSEGIKTITPSGYLIPDDFTAQQKRNVQTIINQLSAKNAFRADEDNDTKRMPQD